MRDLTANDYRRLRRAIEALEQDHREARDEAEARAKDMAYEFRRQALEAANFHAEEINALSILAARVWRAASEAERAAELNAVV